MHEMLKKLVLRSLIYKRLDSLFEGSFYFCQLKSRRLSCRGNFSRIVYFAAFYDLIVSSILVIYF